MYHPYHLTQSRIAMNRPGMSGVSGLTGAVQPVHLERLTPRSLVLEGDRLPSSRRQLGPLSPLAYGYLATLKVMVWLLVTGVPGCGGEKITTPRKHTARKATNTRLRIPTSSHLGAIGRAAPAGPLNTTKPGNANGARLVTFQAFRGRISAPGRESVPDEPSP